MLLLHGASFCKYDQEFLLLESRSIAWSASSFENMEYQQMSCSKEIEKFVDVLMAVRPTLRHTTAM
jgi:hypothetical protein